MAAAPAAMPNTNSWRSKNDAPFLVLVLLAISSPAAGQNCFSAASVDHMLRQYDEKPVGAGVGLSSGAFYQLTANPETGTWSFMAIIPGTPRLVCFVASGTDWEKAIQEPEGDPT